MKFILCNKKILDENYDTRLKGLTLLDIWEKHKLKGIFEEPDNVHKTMAQWTRHMDQAPLGHAYMKWWVSIRSDLRAMNLEYDSYLMMEQTCWRLTAESARIHSGM